jgi:hypothetical protein
MALSQRFSYVTCDIVHVTTLKVEQKYPIVKAERVQTRYGETILLSIRELLNLNVRDKTPQLKKVFLPKRYAQVFKEDDITNINSGPVELSLIFKGQCKDTNTIILAVE